MNWKTLKTLGQFLIGHMTGIVIMIAGVCMIAFISTGVSMDPIAEGIATWMIFIVTAYWFIRMELATWHKWGEARKNGKQHNR